MTDKKGVLIIGYGRAGKRHAQMVLGLIDNPGLFVYDPFLFPFHDEDNLSKVLKQVEYAVICTPPDSHLFYIKRCLEVGVKVLCEKPLCAIGQIDEARAIPADSPVMVAYNYRYHPELVKYRGELDTILMDCDQYRQELPEWGLLLDHCSHDLDIVRMLYSKEQIEIYLASFINYSIGQSWHIIGKGIEIDETVSHNPNKERLAKIISGETEIDIDPDPKMFTDMWKAFLAGNYYPDLAEAIKTQELLEICYKSNEEKLSLEGIKRELKK